MRGTVTVKASNIMCKLNQMIIIETNAAPPRIGKKPLGSPFFAVNVMMNFPLINIMSLVDRDVPNHMYFYLHAYLQKTKSKNHREY